MKKGFTLVELLAVIVIIGMLGVITIPNVLNYFNESKREAMIIQESKLVESGDILVRDYCKDPVNDDYQLQCDELYKPLKNSLDESIIDSDPSTYTRYICLSTLKDKEYYSEKLQYSGVDCSGVVVYRIDENTDIQKESFSVVKCGSDYKTIFETDDAEDFEEFLENDTRADKLSEVFKECFSPEETPPGTGEEKKEYLLTINYTEHNPTGQQVADTISKKIKTGDPIGSYNIPEYKTGTGENEEHYTAFVHSSTTKEHGLSINLNGKTISGTMPAKDVTINIVYSINQYTVTFVHKDAVLGTNTFGGTTHTNNTYELFNGENVKIPYKKIENFKVVSHNTDTQSHYTLDDHSDKEIEILYQQINFNLNYDSKGGSTCESREIEYTKKLGTLCTTTRKGYTFEGWYLNGSKVTSNTINNNYQDITLVANWTANEYQITYHIGNGTSEAGSTVLGTKKCTYDQACTLDTFASLGTEFLYSSDPNYGWKFAGWTNYENTMEIKYANGLSFTYTKDYDLDLYAIGKRNLNINRGIAPTTHTALEQYWNPYSTSTDYLTNITLPTSPAIGNGWTFRGYKGGSTESNISAVTFSSDKAGTTFKANYNVYPQIRSIYERTLTMTYNGNGATSGSTSNQTATQYYSSGYSSSNKNYKEQISEPTITLRANGFTKTGYTFVKWAKGSTSGTQYSASSSYTFAPSVSSSNTETMYAVWNVNTYSITYELNGGTQGNNPVTSYTIETNTFNLPAPTKEGSTFVGWYTSSDLSGTSVTQIAKGSTGNKTFYAKWQLNDTTPPTCSITVATSGITLTTDDDKGVASYDLTKTLTPTYNNNASYSLGTGTFYGYVKDTAGNTGSCSKIVTSTTKGCSTSGYTLCSSGNCCYKWLSYYNSSCTVTNSGSCTCKKVGVSYAAVVGVCVEKNKCSCPVSGQEVEENNCSTTYSDCKGCSSGTALNGSCYSYSYSYKYTCGSTYTKLNDSYCYK